MSQSAEKYPDFYYNGKNKPGLFLIVDNLDCERLWRFKIDEYDKKTREQECKYHAMLGDVARQCTHLNEHLSLDDWKRLCVDKFARECILYKEQFPRLADYFMRNPVRIMPNLNGDGLVALGSPTRDFPKYVAAGFITWLEVFGIERDVQWGYK